MLQTTTFCCYPSYEQGAHPWRRKDYSAYKLVKALKGHEVKGYVKFRHGGKNFHLTDANKHIILDVFGQLAAGAIARLGIERPVLVSVPSSDCVQFGQDAKGNAMTAAIERHLPGTRVAPALRWKKMLPKSSKGGTRNANALFEWLDLQWLGNPENLVLIDDVVTTGGHLLACARKLRLAGNAVEHAVVFAETHHDPPEDMFGVFTRDLEASP